MDFAGLDCPGVPEQVAPTINRRGHARSQFQAAPD
jgi:hypothetical protein